MLQAQRKRSGNTPLYLLALCCLLPGLLAAPATWAEVSPITITAQQHEYDVAAYGQYLIDPNGELRLAQLLHPSAALTWRPLAGTARSFGFSDATYWFRFDIINLNDAQADHFLEIHYPLLDKATLYLVRQGEVIGTTKAGDRLPFSSRPFAFRNFLFKLPLPRGERITVYLQVSSAGSLLVPLRLWHEHDFYIREQSELTTHGLYFGVLLVFALYHLMLFGFTRERASAYHSLYIVTLGLFQAALFGLGYQYLWPESPVIQQYSLPLFMLVALFAALRFAHHFLLLPEHCPKGVHVFQALSLLTLLLIASLPLLSYSHAIQLGLGLVLTAATLLLFASFTVWRRVRGEAGYFFFAWFLFLLSVVASSADKLGWGGLGNATDHIMQLGIMLQIGVFTLAEARRVEEEKQRRLTLQRQTAEELARQIKERTAELEQANRQLEALSHSDGLTSLKNRRFFDEELERQYSAAIRNATPISLAMLDIDLFKRINDNYGHQVGDSYLRLIAALIAAEIKRPLDSACRYGGEEFALILPETPGDGASTLAECIRSAVESLRHTVGEQVVPVTISIGTATLTPQRDSGPASLVQLADQALYQAKAQGRNRVISC